MATYNVAPFVEEAIQSALGQTFTDLELIVVDDGSTDGTPELVEAIRDPRLRFFRRSHHSAAAALNFGLEQVRGAFIALLDGDDRWHPGKLSRHLEFLDAHPQVDLSFSWSRIVNEAGEDTGHRARLWAGPISFEQLLIDNVIGNGSCVVLRAPALESAGSFDASIPGCYDLDVWLRLARLRPGNVCAIPELLTDYRRRAGQLTKDTRMMEFSWLRLIAKMQTLEPRLAGRAAAPCRVNLYRFLAYVNCEQGRLREALRCSLLSLRSQPWRFLIDYRSWFLVGIVLSAITLPRKWQQALTNCALRWLSQCRTRRAAQ